MTQTFHRLSKIHKPQSKILIPLFIIALAHLLRTFSLDWQSFWIDEIHTFYFIERPFWDTVRVIIGPHHNGPLYFLLLWFWRQLTGPSDFALRYFSTLCSVLAVAATWRLARTWFDERVAGWAGLLLAISPFAIWFGQEAKMYALHMLLASLSTLLLIKALRANRWPVWLGYGVTLNLLAYSHFFGAFAIAAQGLITLITTWHAPRRLRAYLITMALVTLPYLPVLRFALRVLPSFQQQDISKGFVTLEHMLQEFASEFALRSSRLYVVPISRLLWPLAALLALGLFAAWRRDWRRGLWVSGLLFLPPAIYYPLSFYVPVFSPKYLSAIYPFFIIILALTIEICRRWWRPLAWGCLALMVGVAGWANVRNLTDPVYQRADWRGAAEFLERHAQADDVITVFAHYADRGLLRYYTGAARVERFQGQPYDPDAYYDGFQARGYGAMWLVLHHDGAMAPHHRLREVAGARYPLITEAHPNRGQIAILGYNLNWRHSALPERATPLEARFENGLALTGYHVDATRIPPTDNRYHPPSHWIRVVTYWRVAGDAPAPDFAPFVHLVDEAGGVWGGNLPRFPSVFHLDPPAQWEAGDLIEAHFDVNLNPVTPPGIYRLILGLTDADDAVILTDTDAQHVELTPIEVTR